MQSLTQEQRVNQQTIITQLQSAGLQSEENFNKVNGLDSKSLAHIAGLCQLLHQPDKGLNLCQRHLSLIIDRQAAAQHLAHVFAARDDMANLKQADVSSILNAVTAFPSNEAFDLALWSKQMLSPENLSDNDIAKLEANASPLKCHYNPITFLNILFPFSLVDSEKLRILTKKPHDLLLTCHFAENAEQMQILSTADVCLALLEHRQHMIAISSCIGSMIAHKVFTAPLLNAFIKALSPECKPSDALVEAIKTEKVSMTATVAQLQETIVEKEHALCEVDLNTGMFDTYVTFRRAQQHQKLTPSQPAFRGDRFALFAIQEITRTLGHSSVSDPSFSENYVKHISDRNALDTKIMNAPTINNQ